MKGYLGGAGPDQFPISEIFQAFSGEAPTMGINSIFLRFAGCNMLKFGGRYCKWCDTPYALGGISRSDTTWMTVEQITEKIFSLADKFNSNLLVITGGEPTIYPETLVEICTKVKWCGMNIQIETNGTEKLPDFIPIKYIVVSPKLPPAIETQYPIETIQTKIFYWSEMHFKFVWEGPESEEKINCCISRMEMEQTSLPIRENTWIMPEGRSYEELKEKGPKTMEFCKKWGYNFSSRIQVVYFGDKRGV